MQSKRKIKPKSTPTKKQQINKNSKKIKKSNKQSSCQAQLLCKSHNSPIEFMCTAENCLKELCGHCILEHANHISSIQGIKQILKRSSEDINELVLDPIHIVSKRKNSEKRLGDAELRLKRVIEGEVQKYRNQLIEMASNEEEAVKASQAMKMLENNAITTKGIDLLKRYLKFSKIPIVNAIKVEEELLVQGIKECLSQNIGVSKDGCLLDTFDENFPKLLHWFEWGKKKLNVYDIIKNRTISFDLQISFKIPGFSRSIILPNCKIYLIGGEEPEYFSRKEVYCFDIKEMPLEPKFTQCSSMPHKKFDFTLCYLNPFIYVLCGKDSSSEVVSNCERYNVEADRWEEIAEANKKRYAGSAIGIAQQKKVFLFGGRSDFNNTMVLEIEEYSISENVWKIVTIKNGAQLWQPVEVCACIQISRESILIFGGSDEKIKDSHITLNFNVNSYSFSKKKNLKRPQVFVTAPVLYGKYVYGVGNEYYLKQRNLHRYSIETEEWDIIF